MESLQGEMFFFFPRPFYSQAHQIGTNSNAFTQIVMLSPKDSSRSDITKLKVSWCHMLPVVRSSLIFRKYGFLIYKLLLACIHWLTLQFHTWQNRQVLLQMGSLFQTLPRPFGTSGSVLMGEMLLDTPSFSRMKGMYLLLQWSHQVLQNMSMKVCNHNLLIKLTCLNCW